MAADSKTRFDKQSTISFTLPISCQICLGKVKQPVLCPNNHVFCGICMEVWLKRNQQCPACRVDINPGNPVQQIRGGLNHYEDENEKISNPQMRKARFELLYKEYEDELERLSADIQILRTENEGLKQEVRKDNGYGAQRRDFTHPSTVDGSQVLVLTRKLQDAQKQYDRLKQDSNRHKQENNELKDENVNLNRENERLRVEIANRSPHRFGRYTVATLESKVESYEKEVKQLNKALERSDEYVEHLEKELESYRPKRNPEKPKIVIKDFNTSVDTKPDVEASKRRLFSDPEEFTQKNQLDKNDPIQFALNLYKNNTKHLIHDINKTTPTQSTGITQYTGTTQYTGATQSTGITQYTGATQSTGITQWKSNLSANSPQKERTPKKVQFDLKRDNDSSTSSFDLERPSPLTPSTSMGTLSLSDKQNSSSRTSAKKHLNFEEKVGCGKLKGSAQPHRFSDERLDDTGTIKSELDELNISLTPELSDCMKLLNRAEKNVYVSKSSSGTSDIPLNGAEKNVYVSKSSSGTSDIPLNGAQKNVYVSKSSSGTSDIPLNGAQKNVYVSKSSSGTSDIDEESSGGAITVPVLPKSFPPESHASTSSYQQPPEQLVYQEVHPALQNRNPQYHSAPKGDDSLNSVNFSGTGTSDSFRLDAPTGNYSYVSNDLSSRASDSFLPDPKKRLFESTDDDFDVSMSPIKTTRHF